jgi:hypothetical protein
VALEGENVVSANIALALSANVKTTVLEALALRAGRAFEFCAEERFFIKDRCRKIW